MSTVQVSCPSCGSVPVRSSDIVVRVCVDHQAGAYSFRCPDCGLRAAMPASDHVVERLTSAGAHFDVWYLPEELREPRPDGDPLSDDDLLEFQVLLQRQDWFEGLTELVPSSPPAAPRGRSGRWARWSGRRAERRPPTTDRVPTKDSER